MSVRYIFGSNSRLQTASLLGIIIIIITGIIQTSSKSLLLIENLSHLTPNYGPLVAPAHRTLVRPSFHLFHSMLEMRVVAEATRSTAIG